MTFIPFVMSIIRLNIFPRERNWQNTIDSFQPIDVGFLSDEGQKKSESIDMQEKIDTIEELQDKLKKI